jgi:hypothetical protein
MSATINIGEEGHILWCLTLASYPISSSAKGFQSTLLPKALPKVCGEQRGTEPLASEDA